MFHSNLFVFQQQKVDYKFLQNVHEDTCYWNAISRWKGQKDSSWTWWTMDIGYWTDESDTAEYARLFHVF